MEEKHCRYNEYCMCYSCAYRLYSDCMLCYDCKGRAKAVHDIWSCTKYERKASLRKQFM